MENCSLLANDGATLVRLAVADDAPNIVPLFDAYRTFFAPGCDVSSSGAFIDERLQRADSVIYVAERGGELVGFLQLYPLFSSWYATRIWFLSDLYVAEPSRHCGVARSLVSAAETFARDDGSRSIMVEIPHREPHLVRFYESLGYIRDIDFNLYRRYLV